MRHSLGKISGSTTMPIAILIVLLWSGPSHGQITVTHGPVVGAATSNSARILLRASSPAEVRFEIDTDSSFANATLTAADSARAVSDFFVSIDVAGLQPDTRYFYRPHLNGTPLALIGHFATFPVTGAQSPFTFAFGACQQNARDPNSYIGRVFPWIARDEPRFFLQIGDWTYPDTTDTPDNPDDYFNVDFSRLQANYRSKYDPDYPMIELLRRTVIDYVYDDHDYSNNNSDMTFPGRDNSLRGYREMFPHYPLANPDNGLWHKFTFGNAEFFVLDTRTQRNPNVTPFRQDAEGLFSYTFLPEHDILQADPAISGQLQMDWLLTELQASTADWKFICTGVPFNPGMRAFLELALFLQGSPVEALARQFGFDSLFEVALTLADSWNGFPASVARLARSLNEANIENVIVLSGDTHTAGMDDGANALFPEIMAGALDRSNSRGVALGEIVGISPWNRGGQTLALNNFNSHYGRVTVFGPDSVRMELVDEFGELIAAYTQLSGHVVSTVALSHAFESLDFGSVAIGDSAALTLLLINTGADTVLVDSITGSIPELVSGQRSLAIPPGVRQDVEIFFRPQLAGPVTGELLVASNDPQSPITLTLRGNGQLPTSVESRSPALPETFALLQNYPNPFNPSTKIAYQLPQTADVVLSIYNPLGQEIRTLVRLQQPGGNYLIEWDGRTRNGRPAASGVYLYRLRAGDFVQTRKMLLLR